MSKNEIKFSIVLCTYNGEKKIEKSLQSLLNQNFPKEKYEIIVVDDGSTDKTVEVVKKYPVKLISHKKNKGIAAARNTGLYASKGEIYVCYDDDCVADRNLLSEISKKYKNLNVIGVASNLKAPQKMSMTDLFFASMWYGVAVPKQDSNRSATQRLIWYYSNSPWSVDRKGYADNAEITDIPAASASYRRESLIKIGGFDESLFNATEDNDVSIRLKIYFPDSKFLLAYKSINYHYQGLTYLETLKRDFFRFKTKSNFYKKHKILPVIFPNPFLVLAIFVLFPRTFLWLSFIFVMYSWWVYRFIKTGNIYFLFFPIMQFAYELVINLSIFTSYIWKKSL